MDMIRTPEDCGCPYQDPGPSVANSPICNGNLMFMAILQSFLVGRCDIAQPCKRVTGIPEDILRDEYDYIVVGGGSAGSVAAGRLSENGKYTVLLLEAGGVDPIAARVPGFYRNFWSNDQVDWMYRTAPGDYCHDQGTKGCNWPRGKALGGTSILNGMCYHRGHPADFDAWVAAGAHGWSYEDVLPFFLMTEDNQQIGTVASPEYHAVGGPMPITQYNYTPQEAKDLLAAMVETGYPMISDLNDPTTPEGFGYAQGYHNDSKRVTTATAFLEPENIRPNLHVLLKALVSKVLIKNSKAYGVEYIRNGKTSQVRAKREVVLCAGALNTPQILMLSGIGPRENLEKLNIPVLVDLPVGQNLLNHVASILYFVMDKVPNHQTLDWEVSTEYLLNRSGPLAAIGLTQLTGFLYSSYANRSALQPDIQYFFNGEYAECSETGAVGERAGSSPYYNISLNAVVLLPKSVGHIELVSTDPTVHPVFHGNYFSDPYDMEVLKEAVKLIRPVFENSSFQRKYGVRLDESRSACDHITETWSDPWIECMARHYTDAQNHQLGTAAIGSVVDPKLKVYNIDGLRVLDAAAIPRLMTGNPQAQIVMVAERGVHFMLTDAEKPSRNIHDCQASY